MIAPIAFGILLVTTTQTPAKPNPSYMQLARYIAGSAVVDTDAVGGFGPSNNLPKPIRDRNLLGRGLTLTLSRKGEALSLTIANGGRQIEWLRAGDSNILGFLEAKDKGGNWRPIEFQPWYTCGNSYHRVGLSPGHGWTFDIPMPTGKLKTQVRWRYRSQGVEHASNAVATTIPATRFELAPEMRAANKIKFDGDFPYLVPISFP